MDIWLNPVTGDYVLTDGELERDAADGLANAIYIRLMTPLGTWWQAPTIGSKLHLLAREKDLQRVSILARQYSEEALQPIIDDGRARSIEVSTEQPHNGWLLLLIEAIDAAGMKRTFQHPVKVF